MNKSELEESIDNKIKLFKSIKSKIPSWNGINPVWCLISDFISHLKELKNLNGETVKSSEVCPLCETPMYFNTKEGCWFMECDCDPEQTE